MDIFKEGKFELLALIETKLKGKGEVSWPVVNVVIEGRKEKKKRERIGCQARNENGPG